MNCLSHLSMQTRAIFRRTSHFATNTCLYGCSSSSSLFWKKTNSADAAIRAIIFNPFITSFRIQCYSSRKGSKSSSRSRKLDTETVMEPEKEAFYVLRKGDIVGVYKTLADCQTQVGSSICDPPVSVYKGYGLPKDTEEYLVSCGLKNAIYTITASDLKKDLFGSLLPCTFHEQDKYSVSKKNLGSENIEVIDSMSVSTTPSTTHVELDHPNVAQVSSSDCSCILEFDGASKGNPGRAGAGAVLRAHDGSLIGKVREGLGSATCNAAEYQAIILGLKYALRKGFTRIRVQGDSKLVCKQVDGKWKVRNDKIATLYNEVKKLKDKFTSFEISHVLRHLNSEADAQANLAVCLSEGQIQEEFIK